MPRLLSPRTLPRPGLLLVVPVAVGLLAIAVLLEPAPRGASHRGSQARPGVTEPLQGSAVRPVDRAGVEPTGEGIAKEQAQDTAGPTSRRDATLFDARVIRNAAVQLRLRRGSFEGAWRDAHAVAGGFGGYVVAASRSGSAEGARSGTITMRVPGGRFDDAVDRLRGLERAKVDRLEVTSQDVTQELVDTGSRLRHDRAVEERLLALLAQTDGVSEVLAVQARLDQVQEQIEVSRGRLQYLEKLTSMGTIEVRLRERGASADDRDPTADAVLADAWRDALDRFAGNVARGVVWLGGALPALFLLAMVAVVTRSAWRRHGARAGRRDSPESTQ